MFRIVVILLLLCFLFSSTGFSQDVLVKKEGEEVVCFIHHIGVDKITYRTNTSGPLSAILRSEVFMIKKRNGEVIYLDEEPSQLPASKDDIHHNANEKEQSQPPVIIDDIYYNPDVKEQPQPSVPTDDVYNKSDERKHALPPKSGDDIHYDSDNDEDGRGSYSPPPSNSENKQTQNYKFAAGLRLGYPSAASIKLFVSENHALEVYAGRRGYSGYGWTNLSVGYQVHSNAINGLGGLKWYTGVGGSMFLWTDGDDFFGDFASSSYGLQGYAGLEYVFDGIPLSITVDWIPTYFLGDEYSLTGFAGDYGTLGVRYIISR